METAAIHFHCGDELGKLLPLEAGDDATHVKWINISPDLKLSLATGLGRRGGEDDVAAAAASATASAEHRHPILLAIMAAAFLGRRASEPLRPRVSTQGESGRVGGVAPVSAGECDRMRHR